MILVMRCGPRCAAHQLSCAGFCCVWVDGNLWGILGNLDQDAKGRVQAAALQ